MATSREDDGKPHELTGRKPPCQACEPAEHRVGADTAEPRVGSARVARPLTLDSDRGAAECRDGDSQEAPGVSDGWGFSPETTVYATAVPKSAPTA
jgi:hypothetical protein